MQILTASAVMRLRSNLACRTEWTVYSRTIIASVSSKDCGTKQFQQWTFRNTENTFSMV